MRERIIWICFKKVLINRKRKCEVKMIIFYIFLVFLFSINHIYISNLIYYLILAINTVKNKGRIKFVPNTFLIFFVFMFLFWVTISTFLYAIYSSKFDSRTIIQYIFTLQYLILIINLEMDMNHISKWIVRISVIQALTIIIFALYTMLSSQNFTLLILYDNAIMYQYFPGWPNSIPIPLMFSLMVCFKERKSIFLKLIIILAMVLTTSRGAYLGIILILAYYGFRLIKKKKYHLLTLSVFVLILSVYGVNWVIEHPDFVERMMRSYDRIDIIYTTFAYVKKNPILGYGGNTIEQLQSVPIDHIPIKNWGHTHNWILEILLRYGLVGLIIFIGILLSLMRKIKDSQYKFLITVFIFLALFQTFIRDFVFIFYLVILSSPNKIEDKSSTSILNK